MKSALTYKIHSIDEISGIFAEKIQELQDSHPKIFLSKQNISDIKVAFVEAIANAIKHAKELESKKYVTGSIFLEGKTIGFDVIDHGKGFSIEEVPIPDLTEYKDSGRGIFMIKQLGDEVTYKSSKAKNVLCFKRHLIGDNGLDLIYELSEAIIHKTSLDEVYQIILDRALELFQVDRASILIYDDELKALKMAASRGINKDIKDKTKVRSGEGISGYVFKHGKALLIEDIESNKQGLEKKSHYKTGSFISAPMICSPLRIDEKPIGVINLTDRANGKKFSRADLQLLSTIANQAMACLYIKGLVDNATKMDALKNEMEQVRLIQNSYLPQKPPLIEGYDLSGRCEMAQSVGGDYYDYIFNNPYLYLVVADVSGHNTRSAITMVNFRSQLKAFTCLESDPAQILTHLNKSLYDDLDRFEQFVSCLLVKINIKNGQFTLSNSGHYPPLFYSNQFIQSDSGLVMGVKADETFTNINGQLKKGDGLVLFTDGAVESMNKSNKLFGIEKLKSLMIDQTKTKCLNIVNNMIDQVLNFRNQTKLLDDITIVSLKRL
ncbi:hypothetical protein BVY03_06110 [bacterium K02(2017)]|nr:hypothetical protein BVY03_06110 [bacterium K02(2017)]